MLLLLLTALALGLGIIAFFSIRATPAGYLMTTVGTHYSPHRVHRVVITQGENGQLTFDATGLTGGSKMTLPNRTHADWFAVWDTGDNLWYFVPGTEVRSVQWSPAAISHVIAGDGGGWERIPKSFYEQLPQSQKDICRTYLTEVGKPLP